MTPPLILPARPAFVSRRGFLRAAGLTLAVSVAAPLVVLKPTWQEPEPELPWPGRADGVALDDALTGQNAPFLVIDQCSLPPAIPLEVSIRGVAAGPIRKGQLVIFEPGTGLVRPYVFEAKDHLVTMNRLIDPA